MSTVSVPRNRRDLARGAVAAQRVRQAGGSALDATLANIGETFAAAAIHNKQKETVERWLTRGYEHPRVRDQFRAAALAFTAMDFGLDEACAYAEAKFIERRAKADKLARIHNYGRPILPARDVHAVWLILRFLRHHRLHDRFPEILRSIASSEFDQSAEPHRTVVVIDGLPRRHA